MLLSYLCIGLKTQEEETKLYRYSVCVLFLLRFLASYSTQSVDADEVLLPTAAGEVRVSEGGWELQYCSRSCRCRTLLAWLFSDFFTSTAQSDVHTYASFFSLNSCRAALNKSLVWGVRCSLKKISLLGNVAFISSAVKERLLFRA